MKSLLLPIVFFLAAAVAGRADEQSDHARYHVSAKCILEKAKVHFSSLHPSPEAGRVAWNQWIAGDLAVVQAEGNRSHSGHEQLQGILSLMNAKDLKEASDILSKTFQIEVGDGTAGSTAKIAEAIGELIEDTKTGLEMTEFKGRRIDDFMKRFGQPTAVSPPGNFDIKSEGTEKTVVVFSYDQARKNIFVDGRGLILLMPDMKNRLSGGSPR